MKSLAIVMMSLAMVCFGGEIFAGVEATPITQSEVVTTNHNCGCGCGCGCGCKVRVKVRKVRCCCEKVKVVCCKVVKCCKVKVCCKTQCGCAAPVTESTVQPTPTPSPAPVN